jgi:exodeoxyribonuclease VIII
VTNQEYHLRGELSCSNIKTLLKNPYEYAQGIRKEPTKAMDFGSCVHKLVLEPDDFNNEFAVCPKVDLRTKEGKEIKSHFDTMNIGKTILNEEDFANAKECADVVNAIAGNFFQNGLAEQSYFSEIDGIGVRCRPDYYIPDAGVVVDIKTTADASPDGFLKSIANFGYHIQAAFYTDVLLSLGEKVNRFCFVAVDTKAPNMAGVYVLDDAAIELGRAEYKRAFEIYRHLEEFDAPVYKDTKDFSVVQTLSLPSWVFYKKGVEL